MKFMQKTAQNSGEVSKVAVDPGKVFAVNTDFSIFEKLPENTQIIFHGMNKSGSLSMSNVLSDSYSYAGRENEFYSHYNSFGALNHSEYVDVINNHSGKGFFGDHYLYGALNSHPGRIMISQFRHPLPRILSAYNWVKKGQIKKHGEFLNLEQFVQGTKGKSHCMVYQFCANWGNSERKKRISGMTAKDMYEISIEAIDRELYAIGIAEYFEESIFLFAGLCGLNNVVPWIRDQRNPGRVHSSAVSADELDIIEDTLQYDYKLYQFALNRFWSQFNEDKVSDSLLGYKKACGKEYNDRIVI